MWNTPQILLLCGIASVLVIAGLSDSLVKRAAALLPPDVRERIWQRETRASLWWQAPEITGIILIAVAILKMFHLIKPPPFLDFHSMAIMAVGLAIVCLANASRSWLCCHYYRSEAPHTPASRKALGTAAVVSLAELALATLVCWFVFTHLPQISRSSAAAKPVPVRQKAPPEKPQWVDEAEALKLLEGKDAAYLKTLARNGDILTREENGRQVYLRDDIIAAQKAGRPAEEAKE